MTMRRLLLGGALAAALAAPAAAHDNIRFEQLTNTLNLRETHYLDANLNNVLDTGEVIVEQQTIATVPGGPIPAGFNLVTTTALDASDTSPPTARFYVDKYDGIGIKSQDDGSTVMQKRINGDESMAIALTGAYDITDGRLVLGRVGCATSASVTIDFTQNGQVVGSITKSLGLPSVSDPVVVKFVAPSGLAFNGVRVRPGNAETSFTFRSIDWSVKPSAPVPDFVGFFCRIDLAENNVGVPAVDTDVTAKFCNVAPGGGIRIVCDSSIAGWTGGSITRTPVACQIDGRQCGAAAALPATSSQLTVSAAGAVNLTCTYASP